MKEYGIHTSPPEQNSFIKSFLRVFVSLFIALAIVMSLFMLIDVRSQRAILFSNEQNLINLVNQAVRDDLRIVNSDLFYLANLPQLKEYLDAGGTPSALLKENFLLFSKHRKIYDQIRFLDNNGMEVIRINFNGQTPVEVSANQLQSKATRYYFKDTLRLERGDVYVSPFDLNVENNRLESPLKPMIRFGTPVFDSQGRKRGVIVLNFLGNELLSTLGKYSSKDGSQILLLNSDGYWLKGLRTEDEWGFMFADRKGATMVKQFPSAWQACNQSQTGQILTDSGLFTFSTIYPLKTGQTSSTGTASVIGESERMLNADAYAWKLVSFVSSGIVQTKLYGLRKVMVIVSTIMVALLLVLAYQIAKNSLQREKTAELIYSMAYRDTLTDLPNRRLFEDRLHQALALAERAGSKVAVLFADLDRFKAVNDTLGHEAGDQLLRQVAGRLAEVVRKSDTVARLGGDEFVLLLCNVATHHDVDAIAGKIVQAISAPFVLGDQAAEVSASVGIAIYPDDCTTADALVKSADKALYSAKQAGRNRFIRYANSSGQ
ncbi:MAG: sensor domain-containing diguanylate cyclase [Trichlorobacter sp.]|uniref:diguanylate cyclase domain-containing protein n=1 Tax=Trichlorobacter sp. TaxID=2911007 RepID=UPI002565B826|nr:sensor domain-containing diguanylate cyclase [Trichlorobacter sp.]MDK9717141.1 sensor domain-containing diguanylate cyclase [Trichlorobacter sp.]